MHMASLSAVRLILPLLLLLGTTCSAHLQIRGGAALRAQRQFDFLTLALTWSGTACQSVKECCSSNACCRSDITTGFTLRALWPDYNDGTYPTCCGGESFDPNYELSNLMDDLDTFWPSYYCTSSSACGSTKGPIWAYQWVKHGTCAAPTLVGQYEYFANALILYLKYNVTEVLVEAGYVPSDTNTYSLEGIISAVKNAYDVTPVVSCYGDALKELQLCFNKELKLQDCPTAASNSDECPSQVSLPIKKTVETSASVKHGGLHVIAN